MTEEDEVLNFIEIFMRAVPSDTFLDPRELQCVLGIEVSNWTSLDMNFPANTGVNMKAVNIRSRSAKGLTTNVRLFKEIYPGIRYVLDVADGVEGYIFSVNGLAEKCCISREAIESKIGKPDEEFPAPHGQLDFAGHGAYSFVTSSSGKKSADFHYVWLKGRACLNAFGAGLRPNR